VYFESLRTALIIDVNIMKALFKIKSACVLCGDTTDQSTSLCIPCRNDLPVIQYACSACGLPLPVESDQSLCGQCLQLKPAVDYTHSLFYYESPIDHLIGKMKYEGDLSCAAILGDLLQESVQNINHMPDSLIPVPLHNRRLVERGFNQSLEISRALFKQLQIPIDTQCVRRVKSTQAQQTLNLTQRKQNIKGCFEMQKPHNYKHVVLIDDVITTGSTVNELARTLKKSGVEKVGVWSIARAVLK